MRRTLPGAISVRMTPLSAGCPDGGGGALGGGGGGGGEEDMRGKSSVRHRVRVGGRSRRGSESTRVGVDEGGSQCDSDPKSDFGTLGVGLVREREEGQTRLLSAACRQRSSSATRDSRFATRSPDGAACRRVDSREAPDCEGCREQSAGLIMRLAWRMSMPRPPRHHMTTNFLRRRLKRRARRICKCREARERLQFLPAAETSPD